MILKYKEDVSKRMDPKADTKNVNVAIIEEQRTFILEFFSLKVTFYNTTCSIGLQSGIKNKIDGNLLTEDARD